MTPPPSSPTLVSAVILTLNEAANIKECLASIPEKIPCWVIDSGSNDETVALAQAAGAQVKFRAWTGFADQRNFALTDSGIETEWVLFIDADERYPTAFFDWMSATLSRDPAVDGYQVPSRLFMDNCPLNWAPGYPVLHPRLVRRSVTFRVNHAGHGEALAPCRTSQAPIGYEHYFQNGSLRPWLKKHMRLAEMEVDSSSPPLTRRARLAKVVPAGPLKAVLRFFYHYVFRLGFLDGKPGFTYALMYSWYELTIYLSGDLS